VGARIAIAIAAALVLGAPAAAQDVTGVWSVTWAQGVRVPRNGSVEVESWGRATLDLRQSGGAVTGTWIRTIEGEGTARWKVEGTVHDGVLRLGSSESEADSPRLAAQLAQIDSIGWEGRLDGDRLVGEMWLVVPDVERLRARRPWHAER